MIKFSEPNFPPEELGGESIEGYLGQETEGTNSSQYRKNVLCGGWGRGTGNIV